MKRSALVMTTSLLLSFSCFAFSGITGDWVSENCDTYSDGLYYGTYNWEFSNNKVSTYIQYYKNQKCTTPLKKSQQTKGAYELVGNKLSLHLSHLKKKIEYRVTYKKNKNEIWLSKKSGSTIHLIKKAH